MALAITLTLVWLVLIWFNFLKKKLMFMQNIIVFILLAILTRNITVITGLNLKWIDLTGKPSLFAVLLLKREILIPILVLIFINYFLLNNSRLRRFLSLIFTFFALSGLDVLSVFYHVESYKNWNYLYGMIVNIGYLITGLLFGKFVLFLQKTEDQKHESI